MAFQGPAAAAALGRESNGADGDRTHNLHIANVALSQLSYGPTFGSAILSDTRPIGNQKPCGHTIAAMCGRYSLKADQRRVAEHFALATVPPLTPRYNIAPTQSAPIVRVDDSGQRRLDLLRWGLVPSWAKDPAIGSRMINARVETVREKPAYRSLVGGGRAQARRCLVPADGFFEWAKSPGGKQPYYFRLREQDLFAMAGLWDRWIDPQGRVIESFVVLTTAANELVRKCHDRMPVILRPDDYGLWLDPATSPDLASRAIAKPLPADDMETWPVGAMVNKPSCDNPDCLVPISF